MTASISDWSTRTSASIQAAEASARQDVDKLAAEASDSIAAQVIPLLCLLIISKSISTHLNETEAIDALREKAAALDEEWAIFEQHTMKSLPRELEKLKSAVKASVAKFQSDSAQLSKELFANAKENMRKLN